MPIVSCFKRLNCLFITVEVIIQPRLKNPLSAVQWTLVVGVLFLLWCYHGICSSDLLGIGNTKQKKHSRLNLFTVGNIYIFYEYFGRHGLPSSGSYIQCEVTVNPHRSAKWPPPPPPPSQLIKDQGPVRQKLVKFNLGLSQTSSTVFSSKNMLPKVTKYCSAFPTRYSNDITNCYIPRLSLN